MIHKRKQNTLNGWLDDLISACPAQCGFQRINNPGLNYSECVRDCENPPPPPPPPPLTHTGPMSGNGIGGGGLLLLAAG